MPTPQTGRYVDADGHVQNAVGFIALDRLGQPLGGNAYTLATAQNLTAQAGSSAAPTAGSVTTPVAGLAGGSYLWDAQFTGTSVVLQALGADGVTWRDVATRTTSGTTGVVIGQGATVRIYNPNASAVTAVSSSLT